MLPNPCPLNRCPRGTIERAMERYDCPRSQLRDWARAGELELAVYVNVPELRRVEEAQDEYEPYPELRIPIAAPRYSEEMIEAMLRASEIVRGQDILVLVPDPVPNEAEMEQFTQLWQEMVAKAPATPILLERGRDQDLFLQTTNTDLERFGGILGQLREMAAAHPHGSPVRLTGEFRDPYQQAELEAQVRALRIPSQHLLVEDEHRAQTAVLTATARRALRLMRG